MNSTEQSTSLNFLFLHTILNKTTQPTIRKFWKDAFFVNILYQGHYKKLYSEVDNFSTIQHKPIVQKFKKKIN